MSHLSTAILVGVGGAAAYAGYRWYSGQASAKAANAEQQAEVTTSVEELVGGQTPLAIDTGGGGIDDTLPTIAGSPYDPYTGTQSIEIDPTTGEDGIAGTQT